MNTDKNDALASQPFSFRASKDGKVFLYFENKLVMTLKDREASRFTAHMTNASPQQAQLLMAKASKNFKHGNERLGKSKQ